MVREPQRPAPDSATTALEIAIGGPRSWDLGEKLGAALRKSGLPEVAVNPSMNPAPDFLGSSPPAESSRPDLYALITVTATVEGLVQAVAIAREWQAATRKQGIPLAVTTVFIPEGDRLVAHDVRLPWQDSVLLRRLVKALQARGLAAENVTGARICLTEAT